MKFTKPTSVAYEELLIRVARFDASSWAVEVEGTLQGGGDALSDLLIASPNCPLLLSSCSSDRGQVTPWTDGRASSFGFRIIPAPGQPGWSGTTIRLVLLWSTALSGDGSNEVLGDVYRTPCLVLPDMLPSLAQATRPLGFGPPRLVPRIRFEDELPSPLNAGGVALPDLRGRATPDLLQTVIYPDARSSEQYDDLIVFDVPSQGEPSLIDRVHAYAAPLLEYVREELDDQLPVRPVLVLDAAKEPAIYPSAGAYCPVAPEEAGGAKVDTGKPVQVIRMLAQAWFAGGLRIWGENAVTLRLALGGALGMKWLYDSGKHRALDQLISVSKSAIAGAQAGENVSHRDATLAMQLHMFEGLQDKGVRRALRKLVKVNRGKYLLQSELISLLRARDIAVPHVFE